jgi:hypothetical protein
MAADARADATAIRAAGGARGAAFDPALREEGQKAVLAAGLQVTKLLLTDLANKYQDSVEARAVLIAKAVMLEPLLREPIGFELKIPRKKRPSLLVLIGFKKTDNDYNVIAEQEKVIVAMGEGTSDAARARAHHGISQQMSLLIYSARAAFSGFAKDHGDFLRDLLGRAPSEQVTANVLTGRFDIDPKQMTLRVLDDARYGVYVAITEERGAAGDTKRDE